MLRNTEGLNRSARLRTQSAMQRSLAAMQRMLDSDREINFRTVATEARVSTAWLYGQQELRVRIMTSRKARSQDAAHSSSPEDRERVSRQNVLATLRLRIKSLEEKNRELTGLLELAYGELALANERMLR
jgi:glucan phosphoethanolaminetransferase (alkaline phosphatase superfamily)